MQHESGGFAGKTGKLSEKNNPRRRLSGDYRVAAGISLRYFTVSVAAEEISLVPLASTITQRYW